MGLADFSVRRPVAITMIVLVFVVLGAVALRKMPVEFFPEIEQPIIYVMARYEGVGPVEVEKLVTKPLEFAVSRVAGVKHIRAVSQQGSSSLTVEFAWGTNLDNAMAEMREKIELLRGDMLLPDDLENPALVKIDPSDMPISWYGVLGDGRDVHSIKEYMDDILVPRIERLPGVASCIAWGGEEREIRVQLRRDAMLSSGVSLLDVVGRLRAEDVNISAGTVVSGGREYILKTEGELDDLAAVGDVVLAVRGGSVVRLRDIADVDYATIQSTYFARTNAEPSVSFAVMKESDANAVTTQRRVREELERLSDSLPPGITIEEIWDSAVFIEDSVAGVRDSALWGALLAVLVLLVFLRSWRTSTIIAIAIPMSIIFTFFPLFLMGVTINLISLGGLAIGVGMLVDNSIVVIENIFRRMQKGEERHEASARGASQVFIAITASTLTTCIVFVPILFTAGMTRILFGQLAASITFSLAASLVVAITLVPMAASKLLDVDHVRVLSKKRDLLAGVRQQYIRILDWALGHRKTMIFSALVLFAGAFGLVPVIGVDFMPRTDNGIYWAELTLPVGAPLSETSALSLEFERKFLSIPETKAVFGMGGDATMDVESALPNKGSIIVTLKDRSDRDRDLFAVIDEVRGMTKGTVGADVSVRDITTMGQTSSFGPIEVKIEGSDLDVLEEISLTVQRRLGEVPGVAETESSVEATLPVLAFELDRAKAAALGLSARDVGMALQAANDGVVATRVEHYGTEVDVRVILDPEDRRTLDDALITPVFTQTGRVVSIRDVARMIPGSEAGKLYRDDQRRIVTVGARITERDLASVAADVNAKLDEIRDGLPDGYDLELAGESEELQESMRDLGIDFLFAILLVYMVLAGLFESFVHPFTIIFSVPFALTGALLGLFVGHVAMGNTISVNAVIGVVLLVGIVVNNAIVLIDFVQQIRRSGRSAREALIESASVRMRPIFLTTATTVLGLFPLALGFGAGAEVRSAMAQAVIGGLIFSTMVSLIIVPVVYTYMDSLSVRVRSRLRRMLHPGEKQI
jgi:HAE1 family hydrophobic/amphiphilic exporter-1